MKKHRDSDRSGANMLEVDGLRKNSSCFSNIKIFLISECALMLAQGTVGAYLVSTTQAEPMQQDAHCLHREVRPCYCWVIFRLVGFLFPCMLHDRAVTGGVNLSPAQ